MKEINGMFVKIEHPHKCTCIAVAPSMAEGRKWWIGKLDEHLPEYPDETHCLHLKTQYKDVTFLCNEADFRNLLIICRAVIGQPDEDWLKSMVELSILSPQPIKSVPDDAVADALEFISNELENDYELRKMIDNYCIQKIGNNSEALDKADRMFTVITNIFYSKQQEDKEPDINEYQINFGNHVYAKLSVNGNKIKALAAINGWGEKIPNEEINIIPKPEPDIVEDEQEIRDDFSEQIDDDEETLCYYAGQRVITRESFNYMLSKFTIKRKP